MDILLGKDGDMIVTQKGDIVLEDSAIQKIRIKLLWFEGEWRWDEDEGQPYFTDVFDKNPDTDHIESIIREAIFDVEEVTEVKDVAVAVDNKRRNATIKFVALTDYETIKEEMRIKCLTME